MKSLISTLAALLTLVALATPGVAETLGTPVDDPSAVQESGEVIENALDALEPASEASDAWKRLFGPTLEDLTNGSIAGDATMTGFGPHCGTPWTCTYTEPGLGCFFTQCTYRCRCAICNGNLAIIDCVLTDDGGCLACPAYN